MRIVECDSSIGEFIEALPLDIQADVVRIIDLLEKNGHLLWMPHSKKIMKGLYELRIPSQVQVRILYTFFNNSAFLLHCFIKKSNKLPYQELNTALRKLKMLERI
jgi:phage-related protein